MPPKKAAATGNAPKTTAPRSTARTKTPTTAGKGVTKDAPKAAPKAAKVTTKSAPAKSTTKPKAPTKKDSGKVPEEETHATATKKLATVAKKPAKPTTTSKKRKSPDTTEVDEQAEKKLKVAETEASKLKVVGRPPKAVTRKEIINEAPAARLNVFVCGEGSSGELGLGNAKNAIDVKRPRLNPNLAADVVGVVQVAVGGMHALALTQDNKIYTWGVNDQGALGRDTEWDGGLMDIDKAEENGDGENADSSDDDEDDSGLNPREATPTAIPGDAFPPGTKFVELAAADSASFALTDEGLVYGWGTFRSNEGILGFHAKRRLQTTPTLVEGLKKIKHLACGENHVLALDHKGNVYAWGSGQQNQLGRRIVERTRMNALTPRQFGLPKGIIHIACGAYHSFAITKDGKVLSWGLNNFGETGNPQNAGESDAVIFKPEVIEGLLGKEVTCIEGGAHHSIATTKEGECLVWGRLDGFQMGMKIDSLPEENIKKDEKGKPRILMEPTAVPGIKATCVAAGSDHCIAISAEGKAYSWGFSANYQTGLGSDEDVEVATMIDNTAVRNEKLIWAGAGGQFSVFASVASKK